VLPLVLHQHEIEIEIRRPSAMVPEYQFNISYPGLEALKRRKIRE
jgi:hypothetical protein